MATINGTAGPDNIIVPNPLPPLPPGGGFTLPPPDIVNGLAGDDTINSSEGYLSIVNGDDGNDQIYGNGRDTLNGGAGDDLIRSLALLMGGALVDGGDGNDQIYGNGGQDTLNGGTGNDTISSSRFGNGLVNGGDGNDLIYGDSLFNTLNGGTGDDTISNNPSSNSLLSGGIFLDGFLVDGGDGNDLIAITISSSLLSPITTIGAPGTIYDKIGIGGNGDDRFDLYLNSDNYLVTLDGGEGTDTLGSIHYNGIKPVTVDINTVNKVWNFPVVDANTIYEFFDVPVSASITIKNVETLEFLETGDGNDIITDSGSLGHSVSTRGGDDQIFGGTGNDSISAGSGNDRAFSGAGADLISGNDGIDNLEGNEGNDTIFGDEGDDGLAGQEGDDSLVGGNGNDRLYGWTGNDTLYGESGLDTLFGDDGDDFAFGGTGNDSISGGTGIDNLEGNEGDDTILGDEGDDGLAGQEGDDSLVGGNGNDRLYGWLGNDVLIGDAGSDTLYGDSGSDRLTGGADADTFNFGSDFVAGAAFGSLGLDTITDFQSGLDKIQLEQSAFSALPATLSFATVADDSLAATRSEIIVYSQGTGSIFYNANGAADGFGNGGSFAQLTGNPSLAATDFDLLPATVSFTGFY